MTKGYNWKHPNTTGHGGGRGNVAKVMDESILTRAQRKAYDEFREYQMIEYNAKTAAEKALVLQQIAMAQMAKAGLSNKRIGEITQFKETKVRDMIDHGRIHLGEEVTDND